LAIADLIWYSSGGLGLNDCRPIAGLRDVAFVDGEKLRRFTLHYI